MPFVPSNSDVFSDSGTSAINGAAEARARAQEVLSKGAFAALGAQKTADAAVESAKIGAEATRDAGKMQMIGSIAGLAGSAFTGIGDAGGISKFFA